MAWTTPRTWTTGELMTASIMNSAIRDDLSYLKTSPAFDGNISGTGTGANTLGAGGSGAQSTLNINGSSASGSGPYVGFQSAGTPKGYVGLKSGIVGGSSNDLAVYAIASGAWEFYTNAALQWGIDNAGNFTVGSANHICDSVGTPTIASQVGGSAVTIAGIDYAFTVNFGLTAPSSVTVGFGHTFNTAPVPALAVSTGMTGTILVTSVSTTQLVLNTSGAGADTILYVLCRGY